jgi:hypothetical protein
MGLFGSILEKLGFGQQAQQSKAAPASTPSSPSSAPAAASQTAPVETPRVQSISQIDVVAKLDGLAASNPQKLNWKTSIVDLLKLLGLDSSLESRKELATELGCPKEKMGDSAQMNMWLHKTVLQKLAENGGNIPKELL